MAKSKSVALTTETECETEKARCPFLCRYECLPNDCGYYDERDLNWSNNARPERCDRCLTDFPGVIEMRGRGRG